MSIQRIYPPLVPGKIERRPLHPTHADATDERLTRIESLLEMIVKCLGIEENEPGKDDDANTD